ncbi:MAG: signal peptidase I [Methanosarcinaceae archaeon]|nr:signal peptidase I [Methanosarcinaceae archaeon]
MRPQKHTKKNKREENKRGKEESNDGEKNDFLKEILYDILSIVGILVAFLILSQIIFGLWTPMVVIESGSMEPNMNIGDIVFIKSASRQKPVTYIDEFSNNTEMFGKPGDVILYRAYGREGTTPIIHRAMYYVNESEPMWEGGPPAPHSGYITKGDNQITNRYLDQQTSICSVPVKDEWVIGTARFKIPYIGKIRLLMPF